MANQASRRQSHSIHGGPGGNLYESTVRDMNNLTFSHKGINTRLESPDYYKHFARPSVSKAINQMNGVLENWKTTGADQAKAFNYQDENRKIFNSSSPEERFQLVSVPLRK